MTSGWGDLWITMTRAQLSRTVTSPPLEKLKLSSASCSAPQRLHLMIRDIPSVPFFGYSDTTCHMHQQSSPAQERKADAVTRSEEHTSEPQSLMRHSYAVICLKTKKQQEINT